MNEQEKYELMWEIDEYRLSSPEVSCLPELYKFIPGPPAAINIYGCGPGRAGAQMAGMGYTVHMLDIAGNCLDSVAKKATHSVDVPLYFHRAPLWDAAGFMPFADWGYCCDVLEHLPTDQVVASLRAIAFLTPRAYMTISHVEDVFGDRIGERLHLTIKPLEWWMSVITSAWRDAGASPKDVKVSERGSASTVVISDFVEIPS